MAPKPKPGADPAIALSPEVIERGRRLALLAQRDVATELLRAEGVAPLDVLHSTMYRLMAKADEARAAGGTLLTIVRPVAIMKQGPDGEPTDEPVLDAEGNPVFTDPKWTFETEVALLVATADVANKAAAYVHPKLAALAVTKEDDTFEKMLERRAAARAAELNLAPGGEIREVRVA